MVSASEQITIALNKGRPLEACLPLLAAAGVVPEESPTQSRKLVFATGLEHVRVVVIRPSDVPTYVEHGAADIGITGKDTLLEYGGTGYYEPLDLGVSRCRLMTAGLPGHRPRGPRLRIATKFINVARRYYAERGRQVELIRLSGAMELAPLMGLADYIVDIVETGSTLAANGLEPLDVIAEVSTRVVVNKASMKVKRQTIAPLLEGLGTAVRASRAA